MRKILFFTAILVLIILSIFSLNLKKKEAVSPAVTTLRVIVNNISYKGEAGKSALDILKQKFAVGEDRSGMVASIGEKTADSAKHEYWAFYINGKLSDVGAGDYKTKNTDLIEWKIEKY